MMILNTLQDWINKMDKKLKFPKEKPKYKEKPKQIEKDGLQPQKATEQVDLKYIAKYQIPESDERQLKKYCEDCYEHVERIALKYSVSRPIIFFEIFRNKKRELIHIKELFKYNEEFRKERTLVQKVFNTIYPNSRVEGEYFQISIFAVTKAKRERLSFRINKLLQMASSCQTDYLFYYCARKETEVNFILFDEKMNCVEFDSKSIQRDQKQYEKEYQVYEKFRRLQIRKWPVKIGVGLDKNEETKIIKLERDYNKILNKILKIVEKDLRPFKDQLKEMERHEKQLLADGQMDEAMALSDETDELCQNRDNFVDTKEVVLKCIGEQNKNNSDALLPCLKRLIIAEKQLTSQLPIIAKKREIFRKLNQSNLVILEGETGSGKSTQLPQILCEYYDIFDDPDALPVLVTQPRKITTRMLAERVASEMENKSAQTHICNKDRRNFNYNQWNQGNYLKEKYL